MKNENNLDGSTSILFTKNDKVYKLSNAKDEANLFTIESEDINGYNQSTPSYEKIKETEKNKENKKTNNDLKFLLPIFVVICSLFYVVFKL